MNTNGILQKHWFHVALHFLADSALFMAAFCLGFLVRFGDDAPDSLWQQWPFLAISALVLSSGTYIAGLYSTHSFNQGLARRGVVLGGITLLSVLVLVGITYGTQIRPLGRGVVLLGAVATYVFVVIHHTFVLHGLRTASERVVYLVGSAFDEAETRLFKTFGGKRLHLVGIVTANGYRPSGEHRVLGAVTDLAQIVMQERVDRVLCAARDLSKPELIRQFCKLRYSGVSVMPLILLCEEIEQYVPLELVTHEWLLNASGEPHLFYIRKVKRLFDIVASVIGLLAGAPVVALAALAIKLTSPGPIFYRQMRSGRFGRNFEMVKLRTMHVDAEKAGVQWSKAGDLRVHTVGRFLRKYRIDEIPQLWQVFCGHMSFVGPRPERPELIKDLAQQIPYYEERLMVQPGITGWAQVSYPYGASVLDARRKLEYDLYYMKHMSVFLDAFIILDTIRTVIFGGASAPQERTKSNPENLIEWERLRAAETISAPKMEIGAA